MPRWPTKTIEELKGEVTPISPEELEGVQFFPRDDPRGNHRRSRPDKELMAISVIVGPGQRTTQRRGTVTAAACRWFDRMGAERILFRMSLNGEFCLLEGDPHGTLIKRYKRGPSCSIAIPPDVPAGTLIVLTDFKTHLVGRMPKKEADNGSY